jgi:hypothetical protein
LFPGDVAWIGCSHTIPVVLFHYTSGWKFEKDIERALSKGDISTGKLRNVTVRPLTNTQKWAIL